MTQRYLARVHPDGRLDEAFNPNLEGYYVDSITLQDGGKILIAGMFGSVNGIQRAGLACLNSDGSLDAGFDPRSSYFVYTAVEQTDRRILVVGEIDRMNDTEIFNLARLNPEGRLDSSLQPLSGEYNWPVLAIAVQPYQKKLYRRGSLHRRGDLQVESRPLEFGRLS